MGSPILLERCRMAGAVKNDPGQWKFIGIEGMCLQITTFKYKYVTEITNLLMSIINIYFQHYQSSFDYWINKLSIK